MPDLPSPLDATVVTPTFNRAGLITRALDSVRTQTRPPARIIVVDDGSSDGTPDVVRCWAAEHSFPVTVEVLAHNAGPAAARNRGIELADTEFVAFLDSDDEHLPHTLQRLHAPLAALPDAVMSFADATIVTPAGREPHGLFAPRIRSDSETGPLDLPGMDAHELLDATSTLLKASIIPTSASFFRRKAALAAGLMPTDFRSGEDWLFWLRLAQQGRFVFQFEDLALHHRHEANLTHAGAAELVAREKLRGYLALEHGTIGITLNDVQRKRIVELRTRQLAGWRYHLSRLGLGAYLKGLSADWIQPLGTVGTHVICDPKSLLRAAFHALR